MIVNPFTRALCLTLACLIGAGPLGCRNPAQSLLPPSAVTPPDTLPVLPPLAKGDLFADETMVSADAIVEAGDTLEVIVRRGAGEEKFTSFVRETGTATVGFLDVDVKELTAAQAERLIEEQLEPYMKQPRVQVVLKKKNPKYKRVFVFGDVKKPGHYPLARHMTVMQAVAAAENYNETALLDEIRVVRGGQLSNSKILVADLSRLFTYGDYSRNLALQENDIVFVPRERFGDMQEGAKKLYQMVFIAIAPLYFAFLIPIFASTPIGQ
jgi:polysaccharide export outer membrane protein